MRTFRAADMNSLHDTLVESLILGTEEELDLITSVDVQIHDTIAQADSMTWDFDLKNSWLTKSRWSMLTRQYLDPEELETWIGKITARIGTKGRGVAALRTKVVRARGGASTGHENKESRTWGSCMLAITYKALPVPQITLFSRTSYLGYLGALDMSVAWMAAKYLAKELGVPVESFRFVWVNQAMQWHNFKSLAYMLNHTDIEKRDAYRRLLIEPSSELSREEKKQILTYPGLRLSRKWLQKVIADDNSGRTYGDMSYNTFRRIVRRFHTEVYGEEYAKQYEGWSYYKKGPKEGQKKEYFKLYKLLPDVKVSSLDLSPIGMPLSRKYGSPFIGGDDFDDDDEE